MDINMQKKYRILLVGDSYTGKTSILERYSKNTFTYQTISFWLEIFSKQISFQGNHLTINIFDTTGLKGFRTILRQFYQAMAAIIIVYDVRNRESFIDIQYWAKEYTDYGNERAIFTLVGNAIDEPHKREVSYEEGLSKAKEINAFFYETSAKDGLNINEMFQNIIEKIIESETKQLQIGSFEITHTMKDNKKNKHQNCF